MRILKQALEIVDIQTIFMPRTAKMLCVQVQREQLCLWYESDGSHDYSRDIAVIGTGNPMPDKKLKYIGTVQMHPFVWHVCEVLS